jgi:hypothetical protein
MSELLNVESVSQPVVDNNSKSSFETPIVETVSISEPTEDKASPSPEVAPNEGGDGELPEFAKRRLGKEQKKYERQIAQVRAELEQERARNAAIPQAQPYAPQASVYQDPITGEYVDVNTPEGQAIYNYQQKMSQALNAQDKQQQERAQKEIHAKRFEFLQDSFEDATERHPDFESVIKASGMTGAIASELPDFPDPGELGYYLASNPREVERLQKLPAYEIKRELVRHMAEMVSKNNITRTPAPVKPIGSAAGTPAKHFAHKTIAELKAERKAQLSGKSRRR